MTLSELSIRMKALNKEINKLLKESGYAEYEQLSLEGMEGYRSPDELQQIREYERMMTDLDVMTDRLNYLAKPVTHEGRLYHNSNDRYALDDVEFCCGYRIECQLYDEDKECYYWALGRVEHSDKYGGYYLHGQYVPLTSGMLARIRW